MLDLYKNIKKYRKQLGITQQDLALKAGYKDKSMIAKIEKGLIDLPQSKITIFAQIFQISEGELMGWSEDKDNDIPEFIYTFDEMITKEHSYSLQIIGGFCKTRRIEKEFTEKYVAEKAHIELSEYIEFEEGANIGLKKIKHILKVLDIKKEYAEHLLKSYCISYDILTDMNASPLMLEHLAQKAAKFTVSSMADEYNRTVEHIDNTELNAAHERTDIPVTDTHLQHDEDIMDDENF